MLTNIARSEAEELGIESCSVAYVPIIGYLLLVPETYNITGNAMIQLVINFLNFFIKYFVFNFRFFLLKVCFIIKVVECNCWMNKLVI